MDAAIIPISSLNSTTSSAPPNDHSVRGVVTLSWPYSSSTKSCALLIADRDFRLRSRKGQVRVRFAGPSAAAVAQTHIGIGDEVILSLNGARWIEEDAEITERTPGKSVGVELGFAGKLGLKIVGGTAGGERDINVDEPVVPIEKKMSIRDQVMATPVTRAVTRLRENLSQEDGSPVYASPAFAKRLRLSGEDFLDSAYDPFADENLDVARVRKRQRLSFGGQWRYQTEKSASPERASPSRYEKVFEERNEPASRELQMPPPALPPPEVPSSPIRSPTTPKIQPVSSAALPLPSPFPDETKQLVPDPVTADQTMETIDEDIAEDSNTENASSTKVIADNEEKLVMNDEVEVLPNEPVSIKSTYTDEEPVVEETTLDRDADAPQVTDLGGIQSADSPKLIRDIDSPTLLNDDEESNMQAEQFSAPQTPVRDSSRFAAGFDGAFSSPNNHATPQSERDRVMKQTVQSLFGFPGSPEMSDVEKTNMSSPEPIAELNNSSDLKENELFEAAHDQQGLRIDASAEQYTHKTLSEESTPPAGLTPPWAKASGQVGIIELDPDSEDEMNPQIQPELVTEDTPEDLEMEDVPATEELVLSENEEASVSSAEQGFPIESRAEAESSPQASPIISLYEEKTTLPENMAGTQAIESQINYTSLKAPSEELTLTVAEPPPMDIHDIEHEAAIFGGIVDIEQPQSVEMSKNAVLEEPEYVEPVKSDGQILNNERVSLLQPHDFETEAEFMDQTEESTMANHQSMDSDLTLGSDSRSEVPVAEPIELVELEELDDTKKSTEIDDFEQPTSKINIQVQQSLDGASQESHKTASPEDVTDQDAEQTQDAEKIQGQVSESIKNTSRVDASQAPSEVVSADPKPAKKVQRSALEHFASFGSRSREVEQRHISERSTEINQATASQDLAREEVAGEIAASAGKRLEGEAHDFLSNPQHQSFGTISYPQLPMSPSMSQTRATSFENRDQDAASRQPFTLPPTPQLTQTGSDLKISEMKEPKEMKTPTRRSTRRSLAARLSHVPDVISAWFSPKPIVEDVPSVTEKQPTKAITTSHGYFTPLCHIQGHVNQSGSQLGNNANVDVLAVVCDKTKAPTRAKGGPRDFFTVFRVRDASLTPESEVRVEVFRPWKATLPTAEVGDVVLLRSFAVKSRKRQPYLLSGDASAWCVWRYSEPEVAGSNDEEKERPAWARRRTANKTVTGDQVVREEVKGPPVEMDDEERQHAKELHTWWSQATIEMSHD